MFWKKLDSLLTKAETKGFKMANKAHIYVINGILLIFAYNVVSVFRDYNAFFIEARAEVAPDVDRSIESAQYPLNRNLKRD